MKSRDFQQPWMYGWCWIDHDILKVDSWAKYIFLYCNTKTQLLAENQIQKLELVDNRYNITKYDNMHRTNLDQGQHLPNDKCILTVQDFENFIGPLFNTSKRSLDVWLHLLVCNCVFEYLWELQSVELSGSRKWGYLEQLQWKIVTFVQ